MKNNNQLIINISGSVCTLTLNNPDKRNILTPTMLNSITKQLKELEVADNIRCLVIKGAGGKAFSSGYDISAIKEDDMTREFRNDHPLEVCMKTIEEFPYPIIAMMNGHTFGAGLELAATCDIRICSSKAKMGIPPVKLGVVYSYSGTKKFINLIGTAYTKELFLISHTIDAKRALQMGLVNYIKKENEIEDFTYGIAKEISENAPLSLKTMKKLINICNNNDKLSDIDKISIESLFEKIQNSEDYKEGQKAFKEKRKPRFKGK